MPTQHEMAQYWVGGAMKRCRESGEPQQSKDWGYGDRKRCVTILAFDAQTGLYEAAMLCWGFRERVVIGRWEHVFCECVDALAGAG